MTIEVLPDAKAVARRGAGLIVQQARLAIAARGRFVIGVSGGKTPWLMLRELARADLPWTSADIIQVDERIARAGDPDRNITALRESLGDAPLLADRVRPMPVEAMDLPAAAAQYSTLLRKIAGSPPVLDVAHLGLGDDGHTASLLPGDSVLAVTDADVALTGEYNGRRRMTLTYALLNRSRFILWLVTGPEKAVALARLRGGAQSIPAGQIRRDVAVILADRAAAGTV